MVGGGEASIAQPVQNRTSVSRGIAPVCEPVGREGKGGVTSGDIRMRVSQRSVSTSAVLPPMLTVLQPPQRLDIPGVVAGARGVKRTRGEGAEQLLQYSGRFMEADVPTLVAMVCNPLPSYLCAI